MLHLDKEHLGVVRGQDGLVEAVQWLDLGTARISSRFFHHDPPAFQEIESAIDHVEDEIMRLQKPGGIDMTLWSLSPALRTVAAALGAHLSLDVVERSFQRLASASLGQASSLKALPSGNESAAALLVLREFMHHLGFSSIHILEDAV